MTYARFMQRFCALFVDGVVLVAAVFALLTLVGNGHVYADAHRSLISVFVGIGRGRVAADLAVLVSWFYYAGCESSPWQATLGKRLLRIAVTDQNGERISFLRASARHFAHILSALPLLLGYLIMPFTRRKQAFHDKVSGCLVVDARQVVRKPFESIRLGTVAAVLAGVGVMGGLALVPAPTPTVYIIPFGELTARGSWLLAEDVAKTEHVKATVLESFPLSPGTYDAARRQADAELMEVQIRAHYPELLTDDNAVVAVTSDDISTSAIRPLNFFSGHDGAHVAIVSLARMFEGTNQLVRYRADRIIARQVDILHFHKPLNNDPSSVLYESVTTVQDIDRMAPFMPS
jgi:uncharacterized RDD family membrane protein YckC